MFVCMCADCKDLVLAGGMSMFIAACVIIIHVAHAYSVEKKKKKKKLQLLTMAANSCDLY